MLSRWSRWSLVLLLPLLWGCDPYEENIREIYEKSAYNAGVNFSKCISAIDAKPSGTTAEAFSNTEAKENCFDIRGRAIREAENNGVVNAYSLALDGDADTP